MPKNNMLPRESSTDDSSGSDSEENLGHWNEKDPTEVPFQFLKTGMSCFFSGFGDGLKWGWWSCCQPKFSTLFFLRQEQKRRSLGDPWNVQIPEEQRLQGPLYMVVYLCLQDLPWLQCQSHSEEGGVHGGGWGAVCQEHLGRSCHTRGTELKIFS